MVKKAVLLFVLIGLSGRIPARADEETRQVQEELRKRQMAPNEK